VAKAVMPGENIWPKLKTDKLSFNNEGQATPVREMLCVIKVIYIYIKQTL
jgi:hypothetical protein